MGYYMIKIVVLGSGGAVPSPDRNLCSIGLRYFGNVYLFDCAEGTQRQMMKYNLSYAKVKTIFLSHLHEDHILGIPGLMFTLKMIERKEKCQIFGPEGTEKRINELVGGERNLGYLIEVKDIKPEWEYRIDEKEGATVKAFRTDHTPTSLGYVFETDKKRRFDKEICKKFGIKGRMFKTLENENEIEIGKEGKKVKYEDVTYEQKGKKVVYTGDTMYSKETAKHSKSADVLFHEASFMEEHRKEADEDKHSTILDAARVAKEAGVEKLVVFHISNRYKREKIKEMKKEGKKEFENLIIGEDGLDILI